MRAETPNSRTRASKYAKIVNGLTRAGVKSDQVPERIKALGGVEAAYARFVAAKRVPLKGVATHDDGPGGPRSLLPRTGGLRAARGGNDDKVQGAGLFNALY